MPKNQFQRMMFALITVVITVHAYVFYSLYVINGGMFMELAGEKSVLAAIDRLGGVFVFGSPVPIWAVVLIEFACAYTLEVILEPVFIRNVCGFSSIILLQTRQKSAGGLSPGKDF